jgi:hypothetical protein
VSCPACATPHHRDCWEYNHGCSIYGCNPPAVADSHLPAATAAAAPDQDLPAAVPWGTPGELRNLQVKLGAASAVLVALILLATFTTLAGVVGALAAALAAAAALGGGRHADRSDGEDHDQGDDAGMDPAELLALETKAVDALVGSGVPDQAAQAYALFEQRHPRASLEPDRQRELAIELIDHGYWALGLEALDKALHQPGLWEDPVLREVRRRTLLENPAYAMEALSGPLGSLDVANGDVKGQLMRLRRLLPVPAIGGPFYLVSLSPVGWGYSFTSDVELPGAPGALGAPLVRTRSLLLAGPYDQVGVFEPYERRWDLALPTVAVPASSMAFPAAVEHVTGLHLSHKAARFRTDAGERILDWSEIHNVVFGKIEEIEQRREVRKITEPSFLPGRRYRSSYRTEIKEVINLRPVVEVHAGAQPLRLRIEHGSPELYDYLGRRREPAYTTNLTLVAKDLARFGSRIRISHGLSHLFSERSGPGLRFADAQRFDEYVLWFWALGTDAVRAQWRAVVEEMGRQS